MVRFLKQPYPCTRPGRSAWRAGVVGLFVGIFLLIFQPFGLAELEGPYKGFFIFGYGLVTFLVFVLLDVLWPRFFPGFYDEARWTVGKQVCQTLFIVCMIGLGNLVYTSLLPGAFPLTMANVLYFQGITLAVAVFPVTILTLLNELILARRNAVEARRLSASLYKGNREKETGHIVLKGENRDDHFETETGKLLFIESADNYSMVHYLDGRQEARKLLRGTLTNMAAQLTGTTLVRCHRGFIVNLDKVSGVSGNAQGYRLRMDGTGRQVPVSRKYGREIMNRVS